MKNHDLLLRKRAEEFLNKNPDAVNKLAYEDIRELIEELHIHQIELGMQNEELQKAHLELEAVRDRYVDLYDFAPVGYMTVSEKGLILEANLTISTMLGIGRSSLIGNPFTRFITGDSQSDFYLHRRNLFETRTKQTCELKLIKKDNTPFDARLECTLVEDAGEKATQFRAMITDISEHKQAENALRESEAEKTALLDAAIDRIRYVDTDMKIIWANQAVVDASGLAPEELVGKTCYQLFLGRDTPCEGCPTIKSKETGRIEKAVMCHPRAKGVNGESYWDAYCVPLKNESGKPVGFIQIARNITEQMRAEEQIRILTHELMKAQESERQMISRELHDRVAQELAAVKITCEMLLNRHPEIQPVIRQKISEITKTLQESIKAVRDLSYDLRPPVLDELGLIQTLSQYCEDFSENNGIDVDFSVAGMKDLKLDFDTEINLYRLVQEGLTNIKKHADAGHVAIKLIAASPNIVLRIEDNGKGFDVQERLANITKEKRMGIRSIEERVKLLQGEMVLRSKPKQGTKIFIKFPYKGKKGSL